MNEDIGKVKQKFEELIKVSSKLNGDMYDVLKAIIGYKLKIHLEEIYKLDKDPRPLLEREITNSISFLKSAVNFNSNYVDKNLKKVDFSSEKIKDVEEKVHKLYGSLWLNLDSHTFFDEAFKLFKTRLERNNIDTSWFKGKYCLDAGCGSGRYSIAISKLGAKKVIGVDIGEEGINDAMKRIKGSEFEKKVLFKEASVLELPFENNTFDFVMSNGVLHHTTDPLKGLKEIHRTLKPGGRIWLYLYGEGGMEELTFEYIRKLLKNVPREITQTSMMLMGLPANRCFYLLDHFYVAIRKTYSVEEVKDMLKSVGFINLDYLKRGVDNDTIEKLYQKIPYAKMKYGSGDIRFIAGKKI